MPGQWTESFVRWLAMQKEETKVMNNNLLSLIKKESLHILRDKRTMLIVMLIPVLLMIIFGFAISYRGKQH